MREFPSVLCHSVLVLFCCVCCVALIGIPNPAYGDDVSLLGRWEVGPCFCVTINDNLAYFSNGAFFEIADVSDPHAPQKLGGVQLPALVKDIEICGSLAYVATSWFGLQIVDISDPNAPFIVGFCNNGEYARAVTVYGHYAFLVERNIDLRVIDISDPAAPIEVGQFDMDSFAQDIAITGRHAFLATWDGVYVLNISNPTSPKFVYYIEDGAYYGFEGVTLRGRYAYFAAGQGGLRIFDISNPSSPEYLGSYNAYGHALDIDFIDNMAIVACRGSGFRVVDITDPTLPNEICLYDSPFGTYDLVCADDFVLTASFTRGMRIVDLTDPTEPIEISFWQTGAYSRDLVVRNEIGFVATSTDGLRIMDLTDPTNPHPIAYCSSVNDTGSANYLGYIAINGDYAYATGGLGVSIFNISNPTEPVQVGFYAGAGQKIAVYGDRVMFAQYEKGFTVLDVSDPTEPVYFSNLSRPYSYAIAMRDQYAYLAADGGFYIANYTKEETPDIVGEIQMYKSTQVVLIDNLAYVTGLGTDSGTGIMVVDISDPYNPQQVGFLEMPGPFLEFAAGGGFLYMGDYEGDLHLISISDPINPVEIGLFERPGFHTRCISAHEDMIYTCGVWVFRNELITSSSPEPELQTLKLLANSPNPFTGSTTISYRLTSQTEVRLGIYDTAGRLVRRLKDGDQEGANFYNVTWNGRDTEGSDAAPGIYFYRLEIGTNKILGRMVLLK